MWIMMLLLMVGSTRDQGAPAAAASSCVRCHEEIETEPKDPVRLFRADIHSEKGLSCHDCHGGDPTLGIDVGSMEDAKSRAKGFIGRPARRQIVPLCASCHSKLEFMRRFNPQVRVDQYTEYKTSRHGKGFALGDPNVATCVDCHGAHGIRSVHDPKASVYPTNVAETCARCHADSARMVRYKLPTNQLELFTQSVHGQALLKNRDISAPTCNDCHGNHGAAPPGVDAVANVCGQCHASQWDLFSKSPHRKAFAESELPACVTCHGHHDTQRATDAMLGVEEQATCGTCHDAGSVGYQAAMDMKSGILGLERKLETARGVLERAERAGMEVSRPLFDLAEGRDRLVRARVEVHRFDPAAIRTLLAEGGTIAIASEKSGWKALEELAYRRRGLAVSVLILLVMIGLVLLKIRQIEKRGQPKPSSR
jgi:Cytochrome c3